MKILLAIETSAFSEAALEMVVNHFRPEGTQVRVIGVVETIELLLPLMAAGEGLAHYPAAPVDLDALRKEGLQRLREVAERAGGKLRAAGFQVDTLVREGNAQTQIVDTAGEWQADLIVVGSHGKKGLDRLLLGSVSEFVSRHARCSVAIVRLPAVKPRT